MPEDLNIRNNISQLVVKALNRYEKIKDAAAALGISTRNLLRYRNEFDIKRIGAGEYYFQSKPIRIGERQNKKTA